MSPRTTPLLAKDISFPRVSGDEPTLACEMMSCQVFSPREWG